MDSNTIRSRKETSSRGPGRPRDPATDSAILEATLALLSERGYVRTSVEAVAERAGVTKPTVYLRYPTKAELATAALAHLREQRPIPDHGTVRDDLVDELSTLAAWIARPHGATMLGTVLAEQHETPELLAAFRERVVQPRRRRFRTILERAGERGQLAPTTDIDTVTELLVGSVYARAFAGGPLTGRWAAGAVDTVLAGITGNAPR